jgi:hypothetical protein
MALEISPRDNVLQLLKALPMGDQKAVMETFIFGSTSKKGRAPKAEGAPKRPVTGDSYIHLVNVVVWPILKAYGESLEDGDVKKSINTVSCRTQVSSALWAPIKELETDERAEAIAEIDEPTIMTAFEAWKANPPAPHCKADKEARSVGSASSKASGSSKKLADMTEDEKKAYYKARAAKAAATRAANKATEAKVNELFEEAPKAVEVPKAVEEPKAVEPKAVAKAVTKRAPKPKEPVVEDGTAYEWKHNFGTGMTAYERVNHEGMAFLYDLETKDYLGAYDEKANAIDASVENPFEDE